jgi:hypothetical protein
MSSGKTGIVAIVHHVDTEGPLREPIAATFQRLESLFGVRVEGPQNKDTLDRLRSESLPEIPMAIRGEVAEVFSSHLLDYKESWPEIEEMLGRLLAPQFRMRVPDSFNGGWIYNWHVLDHAGFITNERSRDLGYLSIFNRYDELLSQYDSSGDEIHWHFHPIPFGRAAHMSATSYDNSAYELHQVLTRRLLEKCWFPRVNRAGFHSIRPDSSLFLEQWIPFDASNQSQDAAVSSQADAVNGRFGDWRGAPSDWSLYHPSVRDWRRPGGMNRVIARCLNLRTRFRNITEDEIDKAFARASRGHIVYVGVTNHDFREMSSEIIAFQDQLVTVAARWSGVPYRYLGAVGAFRLALGYSPHEVSENALAFELVMEGNVLRVRIAQGECFGPQPYLAIKTRDDRYLHDNFDQGRSDGEFLYTFDDLTIRLEAIEAIAVASNDRYGSCFIGRVTVAADQTVSAPEYVAHN